jgi:DNA-binding LytR/AlgR family response regulator
VEAVGNYVKIHMLERFFMTYSSIQKIQSVLPGPRFAQIHRSYIVNLENVRAYSATAVIVGDKKELPIGRSFRKTLQRAGWASLAGINKTLTV